MAERVVVIGAGVGGLVSALLLAHRGLAVTLVDAAPEPGGKLRQLILGEQPLDVGPTVFTLRWVFDEIFAEVGADLDRVLALQPLRVLARHAWRGQAQRLDLLADRQESADAIGEFAGPREAQRYLAFCAEAQDLYQRLLQPAMRGPRPSLWTMAQSLGAGGLLALGRLGPMASLWSRLAHHFTDPRLQQLFGRYATYCGASPWQAPATLMLVAHVEQSGVWSVGGGMGALARALHGLATQRGVTTLLGRRAVHLPLTAGRVRAVHLDDGQVLPAEAVVFNGDTQALAQGLLGSPVQRSVPATPRAQRSLSAVTWAVQGRTDGFPLTRHNVFFDDDYASEFDDIFRARRLPRQGTVYVCAQDRDDRAQAPPGPERLLCLVNAPPEGDRSPLSPTEADLCLSRSLALMQQCGLRIEDSPRRVITTPSDFEQRYPATGGALYGPATHGWLSVFRRPGAISQVPNLFLAGGSVHPGPGVPMAALSGRQAAAAVMAHLDSISPSRRAATSGGTSTPSATTAGTA